MATHTSNSSTLSDTKYPISLFFISSNNEMQRPKKLVNKVMYVIWHAGQERKNTLLYTSWPAFNKVA